ncbi:uncharacterized protein LOC119491648 [Sebastes umbrosus]|uniref:uncharacterized protein LOC119491648 n=1 Tax=Sebastes umbrosus TaxID=72105 RepID=UPI0018A0504F|nr:uncharacterized protein LOC119491648 [Sebastes umbrosus]
MAAVAELSFLLFALINKIHAEELIIIQKERDSYTSELPKEANSSCLISRFVGEEKIVLWNTSDLWSQNSTVPKDLKGRLSVGSISNYTIHNLTHSDSGTYQEECWTEGKVTSEKNISIIICSSINEELPIGVGTEESVDLPCPGAADNPDIQWLKRESRSEQEIWTRVFGDNTTSVMDNVKGRYQVVTNTSDLRVSDFRTIIYTTYTCLVMNQQQCVSSHPVRQAPRSIIYGSVEETAVLPCNVTDFIDDEPPHWKKLIDFFNADEGQINYKMSLVEQEVDQNYSLVFSSLMLNHTGRYFCKTSKRQQMYFLFVCPKFGPPAVELFSEGEEITLRCRDWGESEGHVWFIKSNQTDGRIFNTGTDLKMMSRVSWDPYKPSSLVISNVSLEDTGEYWCAGFDRDIQCVSTTKTLLKYREPSGFPSTFYIVRCSVLSVLLVMLCVVVVAVNQRTRRGEQL